MSGDNLPVRQEIEQPEFPKADTTRDAVLVSQWRNSKAMAIGNQKKEEWIIAPKELAVDLSAFR